MTIKPQIASKLTRFSRAVDGQGGARVGYEVKKALASAPQAPAVKQP